MIFNLGQFEFVVIAIAALFCVALPLAALVLAKSARRRELDAERERE